MWFPLFITKFYTAWYNEFTSFCCPYFTVTADTVKWRELWHFALCYNLLCVLLLSLTFYWMAVSSKYYSLRDIFQKWVDNSLFAINLLSFYSITSLLKYNLQAILVTQLFVWAGIFTVNTYHQYSLRVLP